MSAEDLAPLERKTYDEWLATKNKPSISPVTAAKLFELFLHGLSCQEIVQMNSPQFLLEQVLEARVRDKWDEKKNEYTEHLYANITGTVRQAQVEAIQFTTEVLVAAHKFHGKRIRQYIQTGDEKELTGMSVDSFRTYKTVAETLLKLTGQDKEKPQLPPPGLPPKPGVHIENAQILMAPNGQGISPAVADRILAYLESKNPPPVDDDE